MGTTAEAEQLSGAQVIPATAAHAAGHSDRQLRDIAAFLAAHMSILPAQPSCTRPSQTATPPPPTRLTRTGAR